LFRVWILIPGDVDWCEDTKASFDDALSSMASTGFGTAMGAMPATRVDPQGDYAELVLEWVRQPGIGPWDAVEGVIETAKIAFPNLLLVTDALSVSVERESSVGRDVTLSDAQVDELRQRGEREAGIADCPPSD
jgi:hypothetical protein